MDWLIHIRSELNTDMSTALDLTPYVAVRQATFVKITFTESGSPVIVRMSSHNVAVNITEFDNVAYSYTPNGNLLNVSQITQDTKASQGDVTITLSGLNNNYIADIIDNPIKGAPVEIRRAFFNVNTGNLIVSSGNPVVEFTGIVNNYAFDEGWSDQTTQSVTTTASLVCSSFMSVLARKVSGRRTNQAEQDYWFPGDNSMNRVGVISEAIFDFGGTTPTATPSATPGQTVTRTVTG